MNLNIGKCSDQELAQICVKYKIIEMNELRNFTRETVVKELTQWCAMKQKKGVRQNQQNQQNQQAQNHECMLTRRNATDITVTCPLRTFVISNVPIKLLFFVWICRIVSSRVCNNSSIFWHTKKNRF